MEFYSSQIASQLYVRAPGILVRLQALRAKRGRLNEKATTFEIDQKFEFITSNILVVHLAALKGTVADIVASVRAGAGALEKVARLVIEDGEKRFVPI